MTESIERRVERGVSLLNQRLPGWFDSIDLGKLDLQFTDQCVLGQLFHSSSWSTASFISGCKALHLDTNAAIAHGFHVGHEEMFYDAAWECLTLVWIDAIQAERVKAGA